MNYNLRFHDAIASQLREKTKEKDALIAYDAGLFESASSYFHNIGNALAGVDGKLLNIRKVLESSAQYPEAFRMMREAHAEAVANGGAADLTPELLTRLEEISQSCIAPHCGKCGSRLQDPASYGTDNQVPTGHVQPVETPECKICSDDRHG